MIDFEIPKHIAQDAKSVHKFAEYSGHDSTLLALLVALNIQDFAWPRYVWLVVRSEVNALKLVLPWRCFQSYLAEDAVVA